MNIGPRPSKFSRGDSGAAGAGRGGVGANGTGNGVGRGSTYRPHYYFKRNGRTIPAYGRGNNARRGFSRRPGGNRSNNASTGAPVQDQMISSFLRTQLFAIPQNSEQLIKSVAVHTPESYPGWHLYFYKDALDENNSVYERLQYMTEHYKSNVAKYNFLDSSKKSSFTVHQRVLESDENLKSKWPTFMSELQNCPQRTLAIMALAMQNLTFLNNIENSQAQLQEQCTKEKYIPKILRPRKIYVRPVGFMTEQRIEHINQLQIDQLYCVRVVVKSVGPVDTFASWICYKCSRCQQEQALRQTEYRPTIPFACKRTGCQAKTGFVEQRSSPFTRLLAKQIIQVSEARLDFCNDTEPIDITETQLEVELRHDLVDSVVVGQEVVIMGILKMHTLSEMAENGQMQIYLKACTIIEGKYIPYSFNERDLRAITTINNERDSFKLLVNSMAPEVYGHELVKAGVFLSLIGGAGSQIHDEEEINVLLVGDPGVGRSHIVQICAQISPKGSLVTRAFSSGAQKLSTHLKGTRSRCNLNSGGLIHASYGHCCLDDMDRLATQCDVLMNVMQSRLTTMVTPTFFTTFHCPASIIAASNCIRSHYDQSRSLTDNIRINSFLLNQFHLVFVMIDKPNTHDDSSLGEHIRAVHAGIKKNSAITEKFSHKPKLNNSDCGSVNNDASADDDGDNMDVDVKDKNVDLLERLKCKPLLENDLELLPTSVIKKFITYARQQVKPLLGAESAEALKAFYMDIRQEQENGANTLNLNTGHFVGLIRLCQARARVDFSTEITKIHVDDIISLIKQSTSDLRVGDYIDSNPGDFGVASGSANDKSNRGALRKFIKMLKMRSNVLVRRIFEFDELKDMARRVGIHVGVTELIDRINLEGILIKKGPNMYELIDD